MEVGSYRRSISRQGLRQGLSLGPGASGVGPLFMLVWNPVSKSLPVALGAVFKGLPLLFILGWVGCAHSQKWSSLLSSSKANQPVLVLGSSEVKILWRGGSPFSSSGSDLAAYVLRSPPAKNRFLLQRVYMDTEQKALSFNKQRV